MGGIKLRPNEKFRRELEIDHVFYPSFWSRTKLSIWFLFVVTFTAFQCYIFIAAEIFKTKSMAFHWYIFELLLLIILIRSIFYSLWRLFTISITIGADTITFKSVLKGFSVAYSEITKSGRAVMNFRIFTHDSFHVWCGKRTFSVSNYEFSRYQITQIESLVKRHLAALTLVEPQTISLDKK